jgi:hypothetical protein
MESGNEAWEHMSPEEKRLRRNDMSKHRRAAEFHANEFKRLTGKSI